MITGHNDCGHFRNLEAVLDKLYQKGIKLRKDKFKFMLREVEYNGFMISKNGIRPTEKQYMVQKLL